jgi:hypothetical protein
MINDFIEYWAAAVLLLNGDNSYSASQLLKLQRTVGWTQPVPLVMWNPPWTLSFIFPLGLLDYETAQFLWFLVHALIIFVGARLLWQIYGGADRTSRLSWAIALSFAPTYFVLLLGQIGPLILLGVIGFLYFNRRGSGGLAGASMTLVSIKPHLVYLMWLGFFLWVLSQRQWKALLGFVTAGAIVASAPLLLNASVYPQYFRLFASDAIVRPLDWATPSLGTALGEIFSIRGSWVRWLPSFGGAGWFLWYWSRRAATWNWLFELPLILLVSVATASFAWTFDYIVLLPAFIQCAMWLFCNDDPRRRRVVVAVYLSISLTLLIFKIFVRDDFWYFWAAPAFLVFYLWVRMQWDQSPKQRPSSVPVSGA